MSEIGESMRTLIAMRTAFLAMFAAYSAVSTFIAVHVEPLLLGTMSIARFWMYILGIPSLIVGSVVIVIVAVLVIRGIIARRGSGGGL